ncbi:MAG: hypothetical protein JNL60_06905 [Bacteroidia bacterium]|nr:hypothetical protein [Bacteroidia bacterium]
MKRSVHSETALEHLINNSHKKELVPYLNKRRAYFAELLRLALSDKPHYSWRAAWLLWSCVEKNDKRIRKQVAKIIKTIPKRPDSQQRELIILLEKMELSPANEGRLYYICSEIWKQPAKNPSLRSHAIKTMYRIAKHHPELLEEVKALNTSPYTDNLSNTVKNNISKFVGT